MLQNYIKQNEKKAKNTTKKETSNGHTQNPQE
jgi:hypothetical protein